jgi:chromosome segregation ATPase
MVWRQTSFITFALSLAQSAALIHYRQSDDLDVTSIIASNPIRKVVTMLQQMKQKVEIEAEREKELYEKFMCYCKNSGGDLSKSIADGEAKVPQLGAEIEAAEAKKKQYEEDLKQHQADRAAGKQAMSEAKAIREKEAKAYAKNEATLKGDINALNAAIKAISSGMSGNFLQTRGARILQRLLIVKQDSMLQADREDIQAFLDGSSATGYVPQSGQIVGILKEMNDEFGKDLKDATTAEEESIKSFDGLIAAKTREVNALTKAIETKMVKVGELAVNIANMKNDLSETEAALLEDKKFLADLEKDCSTKSKEWDEITKTRSEELVAIADTIAVLNSDAALELFKKTLPGAASFVQIGDSSNTRWAKALKILSGVRHLKYTQSFEPELDFLTLAIRGKKIGFEKVIKMIDDMVATLHAEQSEDDKKKEYCGKQLDTTDDKKKELEQQISDLDTSITEAEDAVATTTEEIKKLNENIKKLDNMVDEASHQRQFEHEEFTALMAQDSAAKEILEFAVNRLQKFYNPKLYKPPPKVEPAMAQVRARAHGREAPPPPPDTSFDSYSKKSEENNGVVAMINLLVKDIQKEMTVAETTEEDSQHDYGELMKDSAEKRAEMSKSVTTKEAAKATLESELQSSKDSKESASKELAGTTQYLAQLHNECDWLLQYFDMRKTARSEEIDALGKAKAVLSGADFS